MKNQIQYTSYLEIVGVGYKATTSVDGTLLQLKLGLSHDVSITVPASVRVFCFKPTLICCVGTNKNVLTQLAAQIRGSKPPEIYKGKGIRYRNEFVIQKQGKKK